MHFPNLLFKSLLFVAFLVFPPAGSTNPAAPDAQTAFQKMQSLAGRWEATAADGSKSHIQYEVLADHSAVVEHFVNDKMGADKAMVTIYYLDGGQLELRHYCMAKNQPRMKAEPFDASKQELRFVFLDATNLPSPAAGHMHNATFRFVDADHLAQEWQYFENGRPKFTETLQYARVR